jgi:hypothetical protein
VYGVKTVELAHSPEDAIDEMSHLEHHLYKTRGVFPERITRYYNYMRKVLQPQVDLATDVLLFANNLKKSGSGRGGVVGRGGRRKNTGNSAWEKKRNTNDPLPHELKLALDIIMSCRDGEDAAFILWKQNQAPKWFCVLHSAVHHRHAKRVFVLNAWCYCFFAFIEAPVGHGFARGGGTDVGLIRGLNTLFLGILFIENSVDITLFWVAGNKRGAKMIGKRPCPGRCWCLNT